MKNVKIFDVVELKNKEKATVLNFTEKMCLVEIAGEEKKNQLIDVEDIESVIYRNKNFIS